MGRHLSRRYGQVILVSGYNIDVQLAFSWAPKVATVESMRVNIGMPVVRTDGRSVGRSVT